MKEVKDMIARSQPRLVGDTLGMWAIAVMLMVGLHLPGLF